MSKSQLIITKPDRDEYPEWYAAEIELVPYTDLLDGIEESFLKTLDFLQTIPANKLNFRYLPDKWTIKEIWQHVIDCERVLSYRALRFSRGDSTVLHGFDQNMYAITSNANSRDWEALIQEYRSVRTSSIDLLNSFDEEMWMRRGTAGRSEVTVRAVGFLIVGHEIHHTRTIRERYLT